MKHGSLCSGYEGIGLGLAEVLPDLETAWVSDVDPGACKVLAHRFPGVPNIGDMTAVDWSTVEPVDIVSAGFPCQDLSHAGKRVGMVKGSRSNLFHEVVRAVAHLRPQLVVLENVRGLLSGSATFDEPNDTCVCGWPYRRGGVCADSGEPWPDVPPSGDRGDDREGARGAGLDGVSLRRENEASTSSHGQVGCGVLVDSGRGCGDQPPRSGNAAPGAQIRAGSDRVEGCSDQGGTSTTVEFAGRSASLDGRGSVEVCDLEEEDARTELKGAERAYDITTGRRISHCEACGRRVGDRPRRSVERSWMGTVQRELARIGYDARWHGLRAADVGAPHGRFRVFVVAHPADLGHEWAGVARGRRPGPADGGSGPVALLPTPAAHEPGGTAERYHERLREHDGRDSSFLPLSMAVQLLPTPRATDGTKGGPNQRGSSGDLMLPSAVQFLPTPTSSDSKASGAADYSTGHAGTTLTDATVRQPERWGKYADAIARWGRLARPAPEPTEPGRNGNPRLSAEFASWLMGLPDGWITDVPGITRNESLRLAGNGVVPAQCAAAVRLLLDLTPQETP